jgi:starch phosphorylase
MWGEHDGVCKIISITNAQNKKAWMDAVLCKSLENNDDATFVNRKDELKQELLEIVADQTGKLFDRNILTVVWARRFTAYKRADLILKDLERFVSLVARPLEPVQIIWAGKTYPEDHASVYQFNRLISRVQGLSRCAVLTGYEMKLSSVLKKGADVWLNTPRFSREASGTSGMTAAMNGAINFSIPDGWVPEFARHGENAFVIPVSQNPEKSDAEESKSLMDILEKEIIPLYYHDKEKWLAIQKTAAREAIQRFDSDRMAREYEEQLYNCSG